MFSLDNEKKGSRQAMSEDIIAKILDRNNLNEAFMLICTIIEDEFCTLHEEILNN